MNPSRSRTSADAARPRAQSWRTMKEPFEWTASVTCCICDGEVSKESQKNENGWSETRPFPSSHLRVAPDTRHIIVPGCLGRDERRFCDDHCPWRRGALSIILDRQVTMNMFLVRPEPRQGSLHDSVLELHISDVDRCEELRGGDGGRHRCFLSLGWEVCVGCESGERDVVVGEWTVRQGRSYSHRTLLV